MRLGMIKGFVALLTLGIAATCAYAAETNTNAAPQVIAVNQLDGVTKIGIGDFISFRIVEDRDQARSLAVTDSGELDIPYVGRIKVVDKTCKQIAGELKILLEKDYYHVATPLLAIERVGARNMEQVRVEGAVGRPGFVDIPPGEKPPLSKVLLSAGGASPQAKRMVKVTRSKPDGSKEVFLVDIEEIKKGNITKDMVILPGDHIFVEQRIFNFK